MSSLQLFTSEVTSIQPSQTYKGGKLDRNVIKLPRALHHSASCVPPETLGSRPGSVAAGRDQEVRGAMHNWPSGIRVRDGLAGRDILVSSRTSDSCGGTGAVHTSQVARCTVFPPTYW